MHKREERAESSSTQRARFYTRTGEECVRASLRWDTENSRVVGADMAARKKGTAALESSMGTETITTKQGGRRIGESVRASTASPGGARAPRTQTWFRKKDLDASVNVKL